MTATLYRVWKGYSTIGTGNRREICRVKARTIEQLEKFIEEEMFENLAGISKNFDVGRELPYWSWYENETGVITSWDNQTEHASEPTFNYVEIEEAPNGTEESFKLITGENYYYDLTGQEVSH